MKEDWDELAAEYEGNPDVLIADVDCTAAGKSLCAKAGIQSYPTLKTFDEQHTLHDYEGGRDLHDEQESHPEPDDAHPRRAP